jgi:hypothetical protein
MRKQTLFIALALVANLLTPLPALSAGALTVGDSVVGLGLDARISGFVPGDRVDLVIVPPSGNVMAIPVSLDAAGAAAVRVPPESAHEAGGYRAFVGQNGQRVSEETTFEVLSDGIDAGRSALTVSPAAIDADGSDAATAMVTLKDRYGNPLPGRPVDLIASRTDVRVTAASKETDANGSIRFAVSTLREGTFTLRAIDILSDTLLTTHASVTAGATGSAGYGSTATYGSQYRAALVDTVQGAAFDVIQGFEVTIDPKTINVNDMATVTIRAIDKSGTTVEDYVGTVRIYSPSDSAAIVPGLSDTPGQGQVKFIAKNLGKKILPLSLSFKKSGKMTLRVEDDTDPAHIISGEAKINVGGLSTITPTPGDNTGGLVVNFPPQDGTVKDTSIVVKGSTDAFAAVEVSGGLAKATGQADDQGQFSVPVSLDPKYGEYTLHITDDSGNDTTVHIVRDTEPPTIASASFTPEQPQEGTNTLLVMQSEPGLSDVRLRLQEQDLVLKEDRTKPGIYNLLFTAPKPGDYQPTLIAKDLAGNEARMLLSLTVSAKEMGVPTNLKATPRTGGVDLTWDPVTGEAVDHYRVYVGEGSNDFGHTLDTPDSKKNAATVTGLKAGTPYVFAVTAVHGEKESAKSNIVTDRPMGVVFTVQPQAESLFLEWSFSTDISLRSFLVEYGVDQTALTEQRTVPGGDIKADEKRSIVLRDLLPNVTYYVRVTPIATTGDPLKDLVAADQGTTLASGEIHYSASEPLPNFNEAPPTPTPTTHQIPSSGLPPIAWWIAGAVTAGLILVQWQRRRNLRATESFLRAMEKRYHS